MMKIGCSKVCIFPHLGGTKKARKGPARPATGRAVAPRRSPFMIFLLFMSGTGFAAAALATTARDRTGAGFAERSVQDILAVGVTR